MNQQFGTMVHKDTKQVLRNVTRRGRHFTSPRNQTPIRYIGYDEAGNAVELTATEFRAYVPAIEVGDEWTNGSYRKTVTAAEQVTKLQAMETVRAVHLGGPNRGKVAYEETNKVRGIVI